LNLHASIPLISTIGGFISKALTSCSLNLFAAYCYPTPATSQLWSEPCEQIIWISGYIPLLLLVFSFYSGENGCAENRNVSSLYVIQSNCIVVFHLPLLVSCIHVFHLHFLLICIFLRRLMALLRSLDVHLGYDLVLWNYRWHFNIFASFSWFDASFTRLFQALSIFLCFDFV